MSHILIDARESGTSTGRYIDKLVEHLHALQADLPKNQRHQFTIATKPHRIEYMQRVAPGFQAVESPYKEFTLQEQLGFNKQLKNIRPDLVHFGKDHQPVLYNRLKLTTMHDLTTMRFTNPDKNLLVYKTKQLVYKWVVKRVAKSSASILTPTQFVKDDVIAYTGIPADKITVTYEAADVITEQATPVEAVGNSPFIMYIGRPTPHKNLPRLIQAFKQLPGSHPNLKLVLAGKLDANYAHIKQNVENEQITNILFTDFITDGQLRWLYEHTQAYVFPSLSEGFGLPGIEAMLHGAPVVSSDATCLPEVNGDAAHYFDPQNVQSIEDAINEVLTNKQLRAQLIASGRTHAAQYSWRRMAQQTLDEYNKLLQRR